MLPAFEVGSTQLLVGLTQGLAYALLGLGLVLVYRATRVVHFGYGEVGAFGALAVGKLVLDSGWSWWPATLLMVAAGCVIGALWEWIVVRRLQSVSRLVLLVGTIAIGQVMFVAQLAIPRIRSLDGFPAAFDLHQPLGAFVLRGDHVALMVAAPIVAAGLAWFLNRTLIGLAIRGAADNMDATALAGVNVQRISTIVWGLSGGLATLTVILLLPVRGVSFAGDAPILGPSLLLRALLVGLVGRMQSLPMVVAGGIAFGIAEAVLLANVASGAVELYLFLVLLGLLVVRGVSGADGGSAAAVTALRQLPEHLATSVWVRRLPRLAALLGAGAALALPLLTDDPSRQFTFSKVLVYVVIAMSVTVVTGWAGQLSLCQFALVGVSAFTTAGLTARGVPFIWAGCYAVALTTAVAVAVGFPALRLRGLFLAVSTLGFAQAATWVFTWGVFEVPGLNSVVVTRGDLGPFDLRDQRTYYYFCLVVAVLAGVILARLRGTGVGRSIVAVRENEAGAAASTIAPARAKLLAFALSGGVAAVGGVLYAGLFVEFAASEFSAQQSIFMLTMTIIGGVGSVLGAVLGALYVIGLPNLFGGGPLVSAMVSGFGLLVLVLFLPGGLVALVQLLRNGLLEWLHRGDRQSPSPEDEGAEDEEADEVEAIAPPVALRSMASLAPRTIDVGPQVPALVCRGVRVQFGGLVANDDVDLDVSQGEIVGLIGTNGAGKSTLMNAIGGYVPTARGMTRLFGHDVTTWPAHERAGLGVGRVFQDARLFPELTMRECVMVALEARERSEVVPSMLGLPPAVHAERVKRTVADDILDVTGLGSFASTYVGELSTGMRRIGELACLIAGGGRLLLLDEPTGGVAQREVEAFGAVILEVRRQLDASVLLIEHDMPLVMALSDRVVCMTAGRVIAEGTPEAIRTDPQVIAAYLGTDERAIERSDAVRGGSHV